jgi:hypothetical protein
MILLVLVFLYESIQNNGLTPPYNGGMQGHGRKVVIVQGLFPRVQDQTNNERSQEEYGENRKGEGGDDDSIGLPNNREDELEEQTGDKTTKITDKLPKSSVPDQSETIDRFLTEYGSPLAGRGGEIVSGTAPYRVCPYLITAIAVIESGAGRHGFCNNIFGFGDYCFADPLDGFRAVAEALSGEGENGRYYKGCVGKVGKDASEKCSLKIYNSENKEYAETVLRQRDYIQNGISRNIFTSIGGEM